jgi:riboflavin kinase/FMN adenylyltransferase
MEVVRLGSHAPGPAGLPGPPAFPASKAPPVVAVGNFDGVHRGHQALVGAAVRRARETEGPAIALTFDPHPARILKPERAPRSLMTLEHKSECLAALGVDVLAVLPFTAELAAESPEGFVGRVLMGALQARAVVVGEGFRFGRGRAGDVLELQRLGEHLGFEVLAVPAVLHEGRPVSSTRIRESLALGDVATAAALLGRPYFVEGAVVRGDGRGRQLGIPTANLEVANEILPRPGVYAARVRIPSGELWPSVVNVGRRPTFGGDALTVEAHLLGFEADLYGQSLRLLFEARLRDERAFPGREALVAQIREDRRQAAVLLEGGKGQGIVRP